MDITVHEMGREAIQLLIMTGLCSIRLAVLFIIFPPTAGDYLQGLVRNGIVIVWSFFIAVSQSPDQLLMHGAVLVLICLKEALIGLVLGYAAGAVFWVAQSVGSYVDELNGYNNVQSSNPSYGEQTSILGTLLGQCAIVVFWGLGGMIVLLGILYDSYRWWPLASLSPAPAAMLGDFVLRQTDSMMLMLAKMAMPFMVLLVIIDLAIGMAARVAAKLELQTLGQPLKGAFALVALAMLVATFVDQVKDQITLAELREQISALGLREGPAGGAATPLQGRGNR
ncbi:Type III secretion inner membrane protein (YscT,HrcT,SpaR,EscT,EpaR1,homologous to flagellar export components) [plant metagenome]|uniref:Type III secretion inner membrane protein (YscT,HrcT,SpaR,EscT,EpaR1,homologous to flagellar export components) n=1 Tax=plant metagenome TaxID=1297885 RepID=A0A484TFK8_9ZZZZ